MSIQQAHATKESNAKYRAHVQDIRNKLTADMVKELSLKLTLGMAERLRTESPPNEES